MHYYTHCVYAAVYYNNRIVHDASRAWDKTVDTRTDVRSIKVARIQDAYPDVDETSRNEKTRAQTGAGLSEFRRSAMLCRYLCNCTA